MKRFEIIPHTADLGVKAWGKNIKELFENIALGALTLITDPSSINEVEKKTIEVTGWDNVSLLVNFLNEIIYIIDVEKFLPSYVTIQAISSTFLKAQLIGETIDPMRHHLRHSLKAATFHQLVINFSDSIYNTTVIFDT